MPTAYLTRPEADLRMEAFGARAWLDAEEAAREAALARASAYIDRRFAGRWKGTRAAADQALAWPRMGAADADGYAIDDDAVPEAVKAATVEAALAIVQGAELEARPGLAPEIKRISKGVGPLKKDIEYVTGSTPGAVVRFEAIEGILASLLKAKGANAVSFLARA